MKKGRSFAQKVQLKKGLTFYRRLEEDETILGTSDVADAKAWIQPRPQDQLDRKHNFNCEICLTRGPSSDLLMKCVYCNVVCHARCLQKFFRRARYEENWVCFYCVDYLDNSRTVFNEHKQSQERYLRLKQAQIVIAKEWRRYAARRDYLRIYLFVVRMQVMFHVRRRKQMFLQTLQSKLRPMKLRIIRCRGLVAATGDRHSQPRHEADTEISNAKSHLKPLKSHAHRSTDHRAPKKRDSTFYIIITCVEKSSATATQTLRISSRSISLDVSAFSAFDLTVDERLMIPGVSGFSTIVLSVLQRGASKDFLLGQCSVSLSHDHMWKRGGHFNLHLREQEFPIKDHIGMDMKTDARLIPCGSLEFDLITFNGMSSECGYCYATNPDDLCRAVTRLPDYRGFILPSRTSLSTVLSGPAGGPATEATASKAAMGSSESFAIPMKKIWIVIAEGLLFIYSHFGDQMKLAIEIAAFSYTFEYKEFGRVLFYKLHKSGYPDFVFHTASALDSLRWKCAFLCSVRMFSQPTLRTAEGFDMGPLLHDLWMLESLKPNSSVVKEAQQVVQQQQLLDQQDGQPQQQRPGASLRSSFSAVEEVAKIFAANGGVRQSHLVKNPSTVGAASLRASFIASAAASGVSGLLRKAQKQLLDAGLIDQDAVQAVPFSGAKAPPMTQQTFMANVGVQIIGEHIREESAFEDAATNEKFQEQGERFVKFLLTSIAEKKQLLKKTKTSSRGLMEEFGLTPSHMRSSSMSMPAL